LDIHYNIIVKDIYYWLGANDGSMNTKKRMNDDCNYDNLNI